MTHNDISLLFWLLKNRSLTYWFTQKCFVFLHHWFNIWSI